MQVRQYIARMAGESGYALTAASTLEEEWRMFPIASSTLSCAELHASE